MWNTIGSSGVAVGILDLSGEFGWLVIGLVALLAISTAAIAVMSALVSTDRLDMRGLSSSPFRAALTARTTRPSSWVRPTRHSTARHRLLRRARSASVEMRTSGMSPKAGRRGEKLESTRR